MLKNWTSHADYQQFIISNLSCFYKTFPKKVIEFESSITKLCCLDLDILREILKPYYSNSGRLATLKPEIFRSFSLMIFQKETSITNWVKKLHASELLTTCIGWTKNNVPSLGAHYDFISRLWLSDLSTDRIKLKNTYSYKMKPFEIKAPGKNKKLPDKKQVLLREFQIFLKLIAHFF